LERSDTILCAVTFRPAQSVTVPIQNRAGGAQTMPIYEYRCQTCHRVSSYFFKVVSAARAVNCSHCGDAGMDRIMSSFSQGRTEADEYRNLDPRYYKMVDDALGKASPGSDPDHYLRQMAPFSAADKSGDPYFNE